MDCYIWLLLSYGNLYVACIQTRLAFDWIKPWLTQEFKSYMILIGARTFYYSLFHNGVKLWKLLAGYEKFSYQSKKVLFVHNLNVMRIINCWNKWSCYFFFLPTPPSEISLYLMVQSVGSREKLSLDRQLCDSDKALYTQWMIESKRSWIYNFNIFLHFC